MIRAPRAPLAALGLACLLAAPAAPAAAEPGVPVAEIGPWRLAQYAGVVCSAQVDSGAVSLSFERLKGGRWLIGLSDDAWTRTPQERGQAAVTVDGVGEALLTETRTLSRRLLVIDLPGPEVLPRLTTGQRLHLVVINPAPRPDQEYRFRLMNMDALIPAIRACADAL